HCAPDARPRCRRHHRLRRCILHPLIAETLAARRIHPPTAPDHRRSLRRYETRVPERGRPTRIDGAGFLGYEEAGLAKPGKLNQSVDDSSVQLSASSSSSPPRASSTAELGFLAAPIRSFTRAWTSSSSLSAGSAVGIWSSSGRLSCGRFSFD